MSIKFEQKAIRSVMTKEKARDLTNRIRKAVDNLWELLIEAHETKAWKMLGYDTWAEYVNAEFSMSRARSYQIIDQGRVIQALREAACDLSTNGRQNEADVSERDARDLKADLPEIVAEIKDRVAQGENPRQAVAETVNAKREQKAEKREPAQASPRGLTRDDEIAERDEAIKFLENEVERLNAKIKTFERLELMYRDWTEGGWDQVVRKKDDLIAEIQRTAGARIERESTDKQAWANSAKAGWKKAKEHGYSRDEVIDLNEAANG